MDTDLLTCEKSGGCCLIVTNQCAVDLSALFSADAGGCVKATRDAHCTIALLTAQLQLRSCRPYRSALLNNPCQDKAI